MSLTPLSQTWRLWTHTWKSDLLVSWHRLGLGVETFGIPVKSLLSEIKTQSTKKPQKTKQSKPRNIIGHSSLWGGHFTDLWLDKHARTQTKKTLCCYSFMSALAMLLLMWLRYLVVIIQTLTLESLLLLYLKTYLIILSLSQAGP